MDDTKATGSTGRYLTAPVWSSKAEEDEVLREQDHCMIKFQQYISAGLEYLQDYMYCQLKEYDHLKRVYNYGFIDRAPSSPPPDQTWQKNDLEAVLFMMHDVKQKIWMTIWEMRKTQEWWMLSPQDIPKDEQRKIEDEMKRALQQAGYDHDALVKVCWIKECQNSDLTPVQTVHFGLELLRSHRLEDNEVQEPRDLFINTGYLTDKNWEYRIEDWKKLRPYVKPCIKY